MVWQLLFFIGLPVIVLLLIELALWGSDLKQQH